MVLRGPVGEATASQTPPAPHSRVPEGRGEAQTSRAGTTQSPRRPQPPHCAGSSRAQVPPRRPSSSRVADAGRLTFRDSHRELGRWGHAEDWVRRDVR